jgi:hypothetical protein
MSVSRCDLLEENDNNAKSLPVTKTGRLFVNCEFILALY